MYFISGRIINVRDCRSLPKTDRLALKTDESLYSGSSIDGRKLVMTDRLGARNAIAIPILPLWLRVFGVISAVGALVYFSIVPAPGTGSISSGPFGIIPYSVWLHFLGYMGLAIALCYASHDVPRSRGQLLLGAFVLTVGIGTIIEFIQLTLPTRTFSVLDIVVNAVGAGVGIFLWGVTIYIVGQYPPDS